MLYQFLLNFVDEFGSLNVFKYLTFRTGLSLFTSLAIVLIIGGPFIKYFSSQKILNPIRDDGPEEHIVKKIGTPTMGGVIILIGLLVSVLCWGDLTNINILFCVYIAISFGVLGAFDDYKKIKKILFCSVVPKSFNIIEKYLSKKTKLKCYEVKDLNLKSLIRIKANYKQVGSDRLTNAVSLMNNKNNFIVLDFGTATTFDVLIKNTYFGGIIAPGVRLSLNTLSDKATLIPKIDLKKIKNVIGNDTISAVRSGFFWGYAGLIDNIINLIKKETRKSFKVIITGGFSNLFKNSIKTKVNHNKDITINGLIKISKLIK